MRRNDPKTGKPFNRGDLRGDGYVFVCYVKTRIRENGEYYEKWLSPDAYQRQMQSQIDGGVAWRAKRGSDRKEFLNNIKLTRGCAACGYRDNAVALDFDHNDPAKKKFNISSRYLHATESDLLAELEKCTVLCANCHRVRTHEERHSFNKKQKLKLGAA